MQTEDQPKRGRPSDYCAEIAETICDRLVAGESLRAICADAGMPAAGTVFRWLGRHKDFSDAYAVARELQVDGLAMEMIEIVDDCRSDKESIALCRLRIKTRERVIARMTPKKYGKR